MNLKIIYLKIRYANIISKVAESTDKGQEESYKLIKNYRKIFECIYGKLFVKEMILNYRIHYHDKKAKIINMYTYIMEEKKVYYKSDIAISWNLLGKYNVNDKTEALIYSVFASYFGMDNRIMLKLKAAALIDSSKKVRKHCPR